MFLPYVKNNLYIIYLNYTKAFKSQIYFLIIGKILLIKTPFINSEDLNNKLTQCRIC